MSVKIKQLYPGRWYLVVHYNNKRCTQFVGTTYAEAETAKAKLEARILLSGAGALDEFRDEKREKDAETRKEIPTFGEYGRGVLDQLKKTSLAFSTWQRYDSSFRTHLGPALGRARLDRIGYGRLKDLCLDMAERLSRDSVRNAMAIARIVMKEAVREGLIAVQPVADLGKYYGKGTDVDEAETEEVDPYSEAELDRLLTAAAEHFPGYYEFVLCAVRTGLRFGEQRALRWIDIDFGQRLIHIRRNWPANRPLRKRKAKSRESLGKVDMSVDLMSALASLRVRAKEQALAKGGAAPELVFLTPRGFPVDHHNFIARVWNRLHDKTADPGAKTPAVRRRNWHNLRHTYASLLLSKGASLAYVSKQLRHARQSTTLDIYSHWIPKGEGKEVDLLDGKAGDALKTASGKVER